MFLSIRTEYCDFLIKHRYFSRFHTLPPAGAAFSDPRAASPKSHDPGRKGVLGPMIVSLARNPPITRA